MPLRALDPVQKEDGGEDFVRKFEKKPVSPCNIRGGGFSYLFSLMFSLYRFRTSLLITYCNAVLKNRREVKRHD